MGTLLIVTLAGFLLGFFTSIPIAGPISVLVFALGVDNRVRTAIGVAMGGAFAEAFYAYLAFWGFSHYLVRYPLIANSSRGITAVILLTVGILLIRQKRKKDLKPPSIKGGASRSGILIGLTIALLNPTLILTWTAASSLIYASHLFTFRDADALLFSAGVCGGIIGWFALLLGLVTRYRGRFHPDSLDRLLFWMGWVVIAVSAFFFILFLRDLHAV